MVEFARRGYRVTDFVFSISDLLGKIKVPILFSGLWSGCNVFGTVETKMTLAKGAFTSAIMMDD